MSAYAARCRRAQELMAHLGVDWVFVGVSSDLQYLTGYEAHPLTRLTLFMLPQDGRGTMVMPSFEAVRLEREGLDVFYDVKPWIETDNPIDLVVGTAGSAPVTVAIGAQLWGMFLIPIQDALSSASRYIEGVKVLGRIRMQKDEVEIANLLEMGRRMDQVFLAASKLRFSGRTEQEVGDDIFGLVRDQGLSPKQAGGVASGPNSSSAHHKSGERMIQPGDAIWVELGQGGSYKGYIADKTRNFHVGEPSPEYVRIYNVVKEAQETAWRSVRPGMECQEVDRIARDIITSAGYGPYFVHRTGHGLGLDVHEPPYMVEGNTRLIEPGNVFSVEPGIYLPGKFGIRIEDIVFATEGGVENLYASSHDCAIVA